MNLKFYDNVKAFRDSVYDVLLPREAQNLVILGNIIRGVKGEDTYDWRNPAGWVMASVAYSGEIRLVALMTPPFNIVLYAADNVVDKDALAALAGGLIARGIQPPGVVAEKSLAQAFTEIYCGIKGLGSRIEMNQRIYVLNAVNPEIPKIGALRLADERDMSFLPFWAEGFYSNAGKPGVVSDDGEKYLYRIKQGRLYILEARGTAVSMACISNEMVDVAGVGFVYTPPYFRGRGYASAIVAGISQMWLDKGFSGLVLYTDLSNPTSNSIYQKIGYRPIADSLDIKFVEF